MPGSISWQLGTLVANDAAGQIKGYASATSVLQNQSLTLYVTVSPAQTYTIDVYRIGWYKEAGGRLRLHQPDLQGSPQPACPPDAATGLIACNWSPGYTLAIPPDWVSGVYLALLTNAQGYQNYVMFVVRDRRPAAFLYQQSVLTDEAFNNYPDDHLTGKSLWDYNSYGPNTVAGDPRAVKVSFDRPFAEEGVGLFLNWEIYLIRWLERSGYDVTYSTDIDTHANPGELRNHKAFLSSGFNKYWSKEMRDGAEAARDAGVNLAFFGADAASMQVRLESSSAGGANRVVVCYNDARLDPVQGPTTTVEFRSPPVNRPEQTLRGVQYTSAVQYGNNVDYVVTNSARWVYAGTGFTDGDRVPGIVGYEMDRFMPDSPPPATRSGSGGVQVLSQSPYIAAWPAGLADYANSSIYQAPSGAWVFSSGTTSWSWGLDNFGYTLADARIQKTTANVLDTFLTRPTAPATITAGQPSSMTVAAVNFHFRGTRSSLTVSRR